MSQVIRKFQSGGTAPKTFKYLGNQYNQDEVIKGLLQGIDSEIQRRGMKSDQARNFRDAVVNYLIPGITNGSITINDDDTLRGEGVISTDGEYNKSGLLKLKRNKTDNNAKSIDATTYLFNYLKSGKAPLYFEKPTPKKSAFNNEDFLTKSISKAWYGGSDIDMNNWFDNRSEQDRLQLLSNIYKNADYNKLYNDYDWSNTNIQSVDDLKNIFLNFSNSIGNNTIDNSDYNTFAALGGNNLKKWLVKPTQNLTQEQSDSNEEAKLREQAKAEGYDSEEAINAYIEKQKLNKQEHEKGLIREVQEKKNKLSAEDYFDKYIKSHPFKSTISGYTGYNTTYNPASVYEFVKKKYGSEDPSALKRYINDIPWVDYLSGKSYPKRVSDNKPVTKEFLTNNLDLAIKNGLLTKAGDNLYVVPNSENYDKWSFIGYNPITRKYEEMSMLLDEEIRKALAIPEYKKRNSIPVNKQGGILKYQDGGQYSDWNAYWKSKQDKELAIQNQAKESGRTPEEIKAGQRKPMAEGQDWEYEDYARLISAGADVGSIIASLLPGYGTIASAGLGFGSTIGNLTADLADESVNWKSALGNAALGLGMDVVGLIPGLGAAGKGSKIVKNLLKVAPKLIAIWSASESFVPAMQAFNKLKDKGVSEMTVDDWKALANGLTAAAGATRWGASAARNKLYTHKYGTPTRIITTKSGKQVRMSEDEFQRIKRASGITGQNEALKAVKGAENEELSTTFKSWYNPKRMWQGTPETSKDIIINTDAMKRIAPDGTVLVPSKFSNKGIWERAVDNSLGGQWKGWKGPDWLKNWGYTPEKGRNVPKDNLKTTSSSKNALIPLGKRNEYNEENLRQQGYIKDVKERAYKESNKRAEVDDSKFKNYKGTIRGTHRANNEKVETVDASKLRKEKNFLEGITNSLTGLRVASKSVTPNLPAVISKPKPKTVEPKIELLPFNKIVGDPKNTVLNNIKHNISIADNKRLANEIENTRINRKVKQNTETLTRKQAEEAKNNVQHQINFITSQINPKNSLSGAARDKKQNMYNQLFNSRYYAMQDALRNKPLPHKKSNKKKKTSRDDRTTRKEFGGILLREGGLIPKYQSSGKLYRDVQSADDLNWGKDVYGSTGYWDTIDNITLENYVQHNDMQNTYPMLGFTNSKPSSMLSVDNRIKKYQDTFNKLTKINSGTLEGLVNSGRITGRGGSSDKAKQWGPDGLGGSLTWLRFEGSKDYINNSQLAEINNRLKSKGLEAFFNPLNGMINYRPISSANLVTKLPYIETTFSPTVIKNATQSSRGINNVARGLEQQQEKSSKLVLNPADLLATGRMLGGLATNNRAAKIYKSGLKPTLIDTFENYVPLQGDPYAKAVAEEQASNLESMASKNRTSDAALQLAGELDASSKAGNLRFQGNMKDAEMYYKTRMLGQQESDAAKARRIEVANKNRASANQIDAAKKQIDASRITANYQQVLAPWLAGIEQKFRQNSAIRNQLDMEKAMSDLNTEYQEQYKAILSERDNLLKQYREANGSEADFDSSQSGIYIKNKLNELEKSINKEYLDRKNSLLPSSWLFTTRFAKGGQLSYNEKARLQRAKDFNTGLTKDSAQFHKNVLESKREYNKILNHVSSLTAQLIKQAMS